MAQNKPEQAERKKKAPKTRAPRGTGSVFFDKRRKEWVAKVPVGRKPNGRLKYAEVRAPTQAEVVEAAKTVEPAKPTTTLADWAVRWAKTLGQREQTKDVYTEAVRLRINPALGHRPLAAITAFDVEEAAKQWGKSAGAGTVRKTLAVLSICLQAATRAELIPRNPVRAVRRPASPPTKLDLFTPGELRRIIDAGVGRPDRRVFAVCAATGCRIGEALALVPGDYNPATHMLSISRNRTRFHGDGPPKSRRGTRTVFVPTACRPALLAGVPTGDEYVAARGRWETLLSHLGLRYRNPHQLRHSVASHAIAAGVPVANVARDLGDTVETVIRTYCHATEGASVGDAMERLLGGAEVAPTPAPDPKMRKSKGANRKSN